MILFTLVCVVVILFELCCLVWDEFVAMDLAWTGSDEDLVCADYDALNMVFWGNYYLLAWVYGELEHLLDYWAWA